LRQEMSDTRNTLSYIHSELGRIQTIAGTLSTVETQHYKDLTNMGDDKLNQLAIEEQSAARQLGEVKQICLSLAQKVEELKNTYGQSQTH
jgi:hypoxanthine phosphoribosyltransferase